MEIMVADKTWKAIERRIARRFGTRRTGPTGKPVPDVIAGGLSIEVKSRKAMPAWLYEAMAQAQRNAAAETMPAVILHRLGDRTGADLVVMYLDDFQKLWTTENGNGNGWTNGANN